MTPKPAIYSFIALPFATLIDGECLDTATPSRIGGFDVDIITPRIVPRPGGRDGGCYMTAPETPGLRDDVDWSNFFDAVHPWGGPVSWRNDTPFGRSDTASITHLVARTIGPVPHDESEVSRVGAELQDESGQRGELVGDWLEVITGAWLRRPDRHGDGSITSGNRYAWYFDGERAVMLKPKQRTIVVRLGGPGPGLDAWRTALRLAGEGREIPIEYRLLRDARVSLELGEYRRSVLDAATTAEIALSALLDQLAAPTGPNVADLIKSSNRDLGRLIKTLRRTLAAPIPDSLQSQLVEPRNQAIHAGAVPSQEDSRIAISVAAEVLEFVIPVSAITT